ncbi:hypothetical protein [Hymenobacter fodinae]|uniref:Uncharacterized protein n=1 Tax=Hymenobacter fodinae TaxID=2510796 RepID=A0A4Z0P291_9BACT|nr:hypothetical protein [Hymenobacter fodinae]TGE04880.1 hypothetical protein EU556_22135 [Hymenobacter fodinae]
MDANKDPTAESYWTAVGNIIRERPYGPGGAEIRYGTKHFAPGTKVYIIDWYPGMCQSIVVVGLHRKSKRLITISIDVRLVENLRPKVCYNPTAIAKFKEHYRPIPPCNNSRIDSLTKELAETMCQAIPHWQQNYKTKFVESSPMANEESDKTQGFLARLWSFFRF